LGKTVNEARRFLFGFQPSEIAKLCLIASVAFILSMQKDKNSENVCFKWIWIITALTCIFIFRDNLSTAAILYCVIGVMMFIGQVPFRNLKKFILVSFAFVALLLASILFFPEQFQKIGFERAPTWNERFFNHQSQPETTRDGKIPDEIFQEVMAKIAVARGGIIGQMPGNSQQSNLLPQAYSDFIYAIIIEETGIIGGIIVLFLYVILFIRAGTIAGRCTRLFPKYLVMGCALMLVVQAFINMAVSVGLIPVTGQPLPLVSKGGTSILTSCVFFGIILSVSRFDNPRGIKRDLLIEEEFEEEKRLADEDELFEE
jgi:cell division protein FtsW